MNTSSSTTRDWFCSREQMKAVVDRLNKEAAERNLLIVVYVHGSLTELLVRLEGAKNHSVNGGRKTKLVIIGHSFGGAVVYSALSQILVERFMDETKPPETFGDLVILVNPAFEAARFTPLRQLSCDREYLPGQKPLMAILTSETDQATKKAFPLGRWFSTVFETYKTGDSDCDDKDDDQKKADRNGRRTLPPVSDARAETQAKLENQHSRNELNWRNARCH